MPICWKIGDVVGSPTITLILDQHRSVPLNFSWASTPLNFSKNLFWGDRRNLQFCFMLFWPYGWWFCCSFNWRIRCHLIFTHRFVLECGHWPWESFYWNYCFLVVRSCCWSWWWLTLGNWCFHFPLFFLSFREQLLDQINYIVRLMKAPSF